MEGNKRVHPLLVTALLLVTLLSGCASNPDSSASISPPGINSSQAVTRGQGDAGEVSTVQANQPGQAQLPAELTRPGSPLAERSIYFSLDSFIISPEGQQTVSAHANYLNDKKTFKVMLQGHADERGSSEYNLALGQRRAEAVKRGLELLGVPEQRMEAVSFGKERPRNLGHNEVAWAENRRVDILYNGEF